MFKEKTRTIIAALARSAKGGLINVTNAAKALGVNNKKAALILASLFRKGWILRPYRGLYFILPLEAIPGQKMMSEDPWVLAKAVFGPSYIGGWSAAEYWPLTEQLFNSTLVVTVKSFRTREISILGHLFHLFQAKSIINNGLVKVWRGQEQVLVSSLERTLVDCLKTPGLCGGTMQLTNMLASYAASEKCNFKLLIACAMEVANGTAWKRLGYIAEIFWPNEKILIIEARKNISTGYSKLDPKIASRGRLNSKWRLWVNVNLNKTEPG